jgi:SET domain-containing protein
VFALESIPRGVKVIEYTGDRLTPRQVDRRAQRNERMGMAGRNVFFASISHDCVIDGSKGKSGAQFINHCCDPNLVPRVLDERLWFFSRRKIRTGEELTMDYDYQKGASTTPCRCGSPKCRGTMSQL